MQFIPVGKEEKQKITDEAPVDANNNSQTINPEKYKSNLPAVHSSGEGRKTKTKITSDVVNSKN